MLHLGLIEFTLPKYYQMFGISKVKSAAVTAFRSSYRERPQGQNMDSMPLTALEAITDALLEIMEVARVLIIHSAKKSSWTLPKNPMVPDMFNIICKLKEYHGKHVLFILIPNL